MLELRAVDEPPMGGMPMGAWGMRVLYFLILGYIPTKVRKLSWPADLINTVDDLRLRNIGFKVINGIGAHHHHHS